MSIIVWTALGITGYCLAWVNILNNVLFAPEEDRDTFTLKIWILLHLVALIVGLIFVYRSMQI